MADWICTPCGEFIRDANDEAVKCPGCKAPRPKTGTSTSTKEEPGVMMQMKAASNRLREQCVAGLTTGTMPMSDEAQKAVEETDRIQNHILTLEKMAAEGLDVAKTLVTLRADLAKLKPKLPKTFQTLEDQAKAIEASF